MGRTTTHLNLRKGPGPRFAVIAILKPQTRVQVLDEQGTWLRVLARGQEGFVHRDFVLLEMQRVRPGFINPDDPRLIATPLMPARLIAAGAVQTTEERLLAGVWNRLGGLIEVLSGQLKLEPAVAVAVFATESGGRGFAADDRMIIRFENHLFYDFWGQRNPTRFNQHFRFSPSRRWQNHQWRRDPSQPFQAFHGDQNLEWEVFNFARALDDQAAKKSISMGAPQILGANHASIGYESVDQMLEDFSQEIRYQVVGFFNFIRGAGSTSRMLAALQAGNYLQFAAYYNGPGNAARYGGLIGGRVETFARIRPAQGLQPV
jgi:hypothetical protein